VRFVVVLAFATMSTIACGTDVDLGGGGPASPDGGTVTSCGNLVAPSIDAGCRACDKTASDCQANGCYGGYWCDVAITDCHVPPKTCP
jgi:hypothetical protein